MMIKLNSTGRLGSLMLAALASVTLGGCTQQIGDAATLDEPTEQSGEAIFGTTEPTTLLEAYAKVYAVSVRNPTGTCSGTLVRENVVLTARHCVTTDGTTNSANIYNPNQMLIGTPGDDNIVPNQTAAACAASLYCNSVVSITTGAPGVDWAVLVLDPVEARISRDPGTYVPVVWAGGMLLGGIPSHVAIAGYGKYNPFGADPLDLHLNFGELDITSYSGTPSVTGTTGTVIKLSGANTNSKTEKGDSGSGFFVQTNPPGIVSVLSGGAGCGFCVTSEGPQLYSQTAPGSFPDPVVQANTNSKSWEFVDAVERSDFDEVVGANGEKPVGSGDGWWVSSGNYTQWKNLDTTLAIAKSPMETGCVRTRVSTTDDDTSGIVFRYVDYMNYYVFEADDQSDYMGVRQVINGVSKTLASATWTGNWASTTMMVCFQKYGNIDAYINDSSATALHTGNTYIYGGRYGVYNRFNQSARHAYLRATSLADGLAMVL